MRSLFALVMVMTAAACSGATASSPAPARVADARAEAAKVYDEHGNATPCGHVTPPRAAAGCPLPPSNDFPDRCLRAGFRVLVCGCEPRCTGDPMAR